MFATAHGRLIHPCNLVRSFQALQERAGVPQIVEAHRRHSCLSLLAAQGILARLAMEISGHSDIRLT